MGTTDAAEPVAVARPVEADREAIHFAAPPGRTEGAVDVLLDGRRVWSFRLESAEATADGDRTVPWPTAILAALRGSAELALRAVADGEVWARAEIAFTDDPGRVAFTDEHGRDLVVNKWDRAGRVLDDHDESIVVRLLDHADQVRTVLEDELGLDVFVTGGTLLGPVRDGHLIGHDDDVDFAWVSRHVHPVEVAREGFALGRALRRAGFDVVRHSPGHLQMHFDYRGLPDHYVDVFAGWFADGWWHQVFCIRHPADREDLLPAVPLRVEDRDEPAPRSPEIQLEANYGPGWRVPDPAFRFDTVPATRRRLENWFPGLNGGRDDWDDVLRAERHDGPGAGSSFAAWVAERLDAGAPVLDVGCGNGVDARGFATAGHETLAVDWSREAVAAIPATPGLATRVLNLYDPRTTIALGAEIGARRLPWAVVVRRVVEGLGPSGRHHLFRLLAMALRRDGRAYLEIADGAEPVEHLLAEAEQYGLRPLDTVRADREAVTRMVMTWTPRR
ncbi:class I SAM-dependent methyltransferase [Actinomycetospora sp. TBRC 11914]|uniref:class I SAM-dependent methyltransferase n=1 Tax=Actinomycetospora sp. TBRC 11914 TaxID=2729387 RepID=UPI00145F340D|nr:class I SAM-dependent methyltransferase [Actinomycetospora sp. TBRC 11914]NMO90069.1 class I SAM-dependent methyltransferase [Actinomycetospora sp. TBRC 11914]